MAAAAAEEGEPKKAKLEEENAEMKEEANEEAAAAGEASKSEGKEEAEAAPKELEVDAASDSRPKVSAAAVGINQADTTLNVMPTCNGKVLMTLVEGGFQHLLAGARASVGIRAGRYMFEIKILEVHGEAASKTRSPIPHHVTRVGLSLGGSSLLLGDGYDGICFDSDSFMIHGKARKRISQQKFAREEAIALLVNLDPSSPNANTISLFRNGVRLANPQPLPEMFIGKTLFPAVTYKNVTLQVNFGPAPLAALPFSCRMLADAASEDTEPAAVKLPEDGKFEVLLPIGLPEQGYFDWVDDYCASHPEYCELSDRKLIEWSAKSGLWKPKIPNQGSNDKPMIKFGVPTIDDMSVTRILGHVAPTQRRSFILPELRTNLISAERRETLLKYGGPEFKKIAVVVMGEPSTEYKAKVQELIVADKKAKAQAERKRKALEEDRKRILEEKKKKAEEAKKAKEGAQKRKLAEGAAKEGEEVVEEERKEEEGTKPPAVPEEIVVELTEEEKSLCYRKLDVPDLDEKTLATHYASFSLPTLQEGFDEITFAWQPESACSTLLKEWIFHKKMTQRVEDLQPGAWFKEEFAKWQKTLQEWRKKQQEWRDPAKKKALLAKKKEEAKKKAEEAGETETALPEVNVDDLDVFTVEDVCDIGTGEPLFANFVYEDWTLLAVRFELHLMLHSWKKDLNDPDRPSFGEAHLSFYYNKYFKKPLTLKNFGMSKLADFVELIRDTLTIDAKTNFLEAVLPEDVALAQFMKLAEDHRRERQRRLDAGDETAELKFIRPTPPPRGPPTTTNTNSQQTRGGTGSSKAPYSDYNYSSGQKRSYQSSSSYASAKTARTSYTGNYSSGSYSRR